MHTDTFDRASGKWQLATLQALQGAKPAHVFQETLTTENRLLKVLQLYSSSRRL